MTDEYVCSIDACNEVATGTVYVYGKTYNACAEHVGDDTAPLPAVRLKACIIAAAKKRERNANPPVPPTEVDDLRAQLAAVTAERDELRRRLSLAQDHAVCGGRDVEALGKRLRSMVGLLGGGDDA